MVAGSTGGESQSVGSQLVSLQRGFPVRWQMQEAKQRFSEVLRAAEAGEPQIVTKHGAEVAVVMDIAEYRRLRGEQVGLMEYLRVDPLGDVDLDAEIDRRREEPRNASCR
jgi:prevent-host-death family protein